MQFYVSIHVAAVDIGFTLFVTVCVVKIYIVLCWDLRQRFIQKLFDIAKKIRFRIWLKNDHYRHHKPSVYQKPHSIPDPIKLPMQIPRVKNHDSNLKKEQNRSNYEANAEGHKYILNDLKFKVLLFDLKIVYSYSHCKVNPKEED